MLSMSWHVGLVSVLLPGVSVSTKDAKDRPLTQIITATLIHANS